MSLHRGNRTNPWPASLVVTEDGNEEIPEQSDMLPRNPLRSGPAPAQFEDGVPRSSGPAPLHSVPRDLDIHLGEHPAPPIARTAGEITTEPRDEEIGVEMLLPLHQQTNQDKTDDIAADALLFGIEQDPPSRFAPKLRPKATPEALRAGAFSSSHLPVAPPSRQEPPIFEDKVVVTESEFERLGSPDDEVTNPQARVPASIRALAAYDTVPNVEPVDLVTASRDRAKRQEKTVDVRNRFKALPVLVFVALFLSVILAAVISWPLVTSFGEAEPTPSTTVGAFVIQAAGPAPDAPILAPALDIDTPIVAAPRKASKKTHATPATTRDTTKRDTTKRDGLFQRSRTELE